MKKIMAVITAVLFVSGLMVANMAFAEGAADKAAAPMSDKTMDGDKVSKDVKKDKSKGTHAQKKKGSKKKKMAKVKKSKKEAIK